MAAPLGYDVAGNNDMGPPIIREGLPDCHFRPADLNIINARSTEPKNLGITPTRGPANQRFITETSRLATFEGWPPSLNQKPEDLAKAGFYYEGRADEVKCFSCDGGLSSWEPEDTPEEEHRMWFPNCAFISLLSKPSTRAITKIIQSSSMAISTSNMDIPSETVLSNDTVNDKTELNEDNRSNSTKTLVLNDVHDPREAKLKKEIQQLRDDQTCKICFENEACVVFLPCGHLSSCTSCASALTTCPVCRAPIMALVRAYMS